MVLLKARSRAQGNPADLVHYFGFLPVSSSRHTTYKRELLPLMLLPSAGASGAAGAGGGGFLTLLQISFLVAL